MRAAGIHLALSLCIAAVAAALVFGLWYPYPYREISGGRELFLLVVTVDVILGPLITLAIFNRANKPLRALAADLVVVGVIQLAALGYGLWTVFVARPVHLVFEYSRLSVLHAVDVEPQQLALAPPALRTLPVTGPTLIALRPFRNADEQFDVTMAALGGVPLQTRADLWQPYAEATAKVLEVAKPAAQLLARFPHETARIGDAVAATRKPIDALRYLPLMGRNQAWTALVDKDSAEPLEFLPLDSF